MDKLEIGGKVFDAYTVKTANTSILIIRGGCGMLACGYLNLETANKLGDALAIVTGVGSYADMLKKPVVAVSKAAEALGVKPGVSGEDAVSLLA